MTRPIDLLLVEDNAGDAMLVQRSLARAKILNAVHRVSTGEDALAYLHERARDDALPHLVLLDLALPGMGGEQVLAAIRAEPSLASLTVVILTSSDEDAAVMRSYALAANGFVVKPLDAEQLLAVAQNVQGFAIAIVATDKV